MTPRTLLRTAALNALAAAAGMAGQNQDYAPLANAQVWLGQTWPTQSPAPGAGPMPNQVLIYIWNEKSDDVAGNTTSPQFETTAMLVVEARVETRTPAASATLPQTPTALAIAAAVDGVLDALTYAVKAAVCAGVQVAAMALNGGSPVIQGIKSVEVADKLAETGQRIAGNGVVTFDLVFGETFGQLAPFTALSDLAVLIGAEAGGFANSGNTGNGTLSAVTIGLGAAAGDYGVLFSAPTAYAVSAPGGAALGNGTVGAQFAGGGLTFTIGAGTVPFAAGDGFTVAVQVAAEQQLNLSA